MHPVFEFSDGDSKRRKINLGGSSSASSHAVILQQVKAQRTEREETRRRQENAIRLQAWWRGVQGARSFRKEIQSTFQQDITGITGLRCLLLMGDDDEALALWSNTIVSSGEGALFHLANGSQHASWLTLVRQTSCRLLCSVAKSPQSPGAVSHLRVLNALCSPSIVSRYLGTRAPSVVQDITRYLIKHRLYYNLAKAITAIPIENKDVAAALPLLVPLITLPFTTLSPTSIPYLQAFLDLITSVLTIPLLPNRIPLRHLTTLSSGLPMASFNVVTEKIPMLVDYLSMEASIHLVANLLVFVPPRYKKLSEASMDAYLLLMIHLLSKLPANTLSVRLADKSKMTGWSTQDSDSEDEPEVTLVNDFTPPLPKVKIPELDQRTLKRLSVLPTHMHLLSILPHKNRMRLAEFLFALTTSWPAEKELVLGTFAVYGGGELVSEIYRDIVRGSSIGKDHAPGQFLDPGMNSTWIMLFFLTELYTRLLLTMEDDEFFSNPSTSVPGNPLTLDELISFSRQMMNVAFPLYWRDDHTGAMDGVISLGGLKFKWERVRESVTKCLVAIHARDSRKPFTPAGHWLVTSQIDMSSFVEAAVYEEQNLQSTNISSRPLTKRQMAYISPRLGILNNIPFAIPFETRVLIFRHFVANDMISRTGGVDRHSRLMSRMRNGTKITVRRGMVAQDGFDKLSDADLKGTIEITFVDQFGQEEAGIDGGGVFKEFLTSLCKEVFDTDHGLWLATKKNELYPNPHAYATELHSLNWYRFIGRILGKALYEGILTEAAFASFFLAKWLGRQGFLDDLVSLDPELYQGLIFLKHYDGDFEDLALNFTVAVDEFGIAKSVDLILGGSEIPVTKENQHLYIHLMSHYRLSKQIRLQSEAFFEGLSEIIDPKWLRMFNQQELQILLGGTNSPVDLDDLRENTKYGGAYDENDPTIQFFWKVVESFDQDQRRGLLRFVTSCSRPPLLGFKELVPNFAIRDAGPDELRLPTSSTCVNLLKLPRYKSEAVLRNKLIQAITSNAGFDLS